MGLFGNHHNIELNNEVFPNVWGFGSQRIASGESPAIGRITTPKDAHVLEPMNMLCYTAKGKKFVHQLTLTLRGLSGISRLAQCGHKGP